MIKAESAKNMNFHFVKCLPFKLLNLVLLTSLLSACLYNEDDSCTDCASLNSSDEVSSPSGSSQPDNVVDENLEGGNQSSVGAPEEESADTSTSSNTAFRMMSVNGDDSQLVDGTFSAASSESQLNSGTQSELEIHQGGFGSLSRCGLDGEVVKVTNLNDSGPGSLREAIEMRVPRTIVFEVSGIIPLSSPLIIESPFVTIAGQTAPAPGIALHHSRLRIHAHDVCVQHLRIRHGDLDANQRRISRQEASAADALVIRGRETKPVYNVVLDNISVSWSIDEAISVYGNTSDVTIRDSIIAEPLTLNAHGREHAYCLLIKDGVRRVSIIGNLFSQCQRRSPRMDGGSLQYVNNLIYNAGEYAVHVHDEDIDVTMVGNVMDFPDYQLYKWDAEGAQELFASRSSDARLYARNNIVPQDKVLHQAREQGLPVAEESAPHVWEGSVKVLAPEEVQAHLADWVGAFPSDRDATDTRVVSLIEFGLGDYIDSQSEVGGYGYLEQNYRRLQIPEDPQGDRDGDGISNLVEWLQSFVNRLE